MPSSSTADPFVEDDEMRDGIGEVQRRPPMHNFSLNVMTNSDVRAMYQYLRHLGPAGAPAPSALPQGKEAPKPYVQFPE